MDNDNCKKDRIDNFLLEGWEPTPVEQALLNGTFKPTLKECQEVFEEITEDFLEIQDFNTAMQEIKCEIENRDNHSS